MAQADLKMQEVINHHNELRRETTARRDAVRGFLAAIGQSSLPQSLNDALKSLGDSLIMGSFSHEEDEEDEQGGGL